MTKKNPWKTELIIRAGSGSPTVEVVAVAAATAFCKPVVATTKDKPKISLLFPSVMITKPDHQKKRRC